MIKYIMDGFDFSEIVGFDWDEGNLTKNWEKHKVTNQEAEDAFRDPNFQIFDDKTHSQKEQRYLMFAKTGDRRKLTLAFTIRNNRIRIISARDMSRKEKNDYEKKT